jgi:PAS domain S-box-containing protein
MKAAVDWANKIYGYCLVEQLYCGSRTLVYRAIRQSDQQPVVIKLLKADYPSFNELLQFRNQYTIAKNLNLPGIVTPYSLESYGNSYALVMEDFGGISLKDYVKTHSLELAEFLHIGIQLAGILHSLHRHRVIHKDIKPANILINPNSKEVKLIDFSIASLLPRETQEIQNPNVLEGTLAYLSPEQTGRMNRGIDYRTDFYSLGIVFYELLSGELPFSTTDPIELVHCHIAKNPPSLQDIKSQKLKFKSVEIEEVLGAKHSHENPIKFLKEQPRNASPDPNAKEPTEAIEIPAVLSKIVMKLMAKNAEDRYQTALGLKHDLEMCLHRLQNGSIELFEIAQRDICDQFIIPEKLYGRETEVQTLLDAFERVSQGSTEIMLVAGFSGIGKTAVVNEVHKPIVRQRGYFIKGKYDQFQRNIPFSAFVQAFRDLMGQLLSETDAQLEQWKTKILAALGENAQVIIDVIPELEYIIGKQLMAAELSADAAQNRFKLLFQKFISVFSAPEHPLAIFIDDLQWADSASLKLMELLTSEAKTHYLLFIGAYRDNEVTPAHPLMLTLEDIQKAGVIVNSILLSPLDQQSTNQLITETLIYPQELTLPLTNLVIKKTKGNPFFITQFLKALYEDGSIIFNVDRGSWEYDITQVHSLTFGDDIVEFMRLQLQKLSQTAQTILKLAACIGNQFDLATLAIVYEKSPAETATDLWSLLQEGLILPTSEVYKFFQEHPESLTIQPKEINQLASSYASLPHYKFLHDRVQQAAYTLIPDNQKQLTHLKIGRGLLTTSTEAERDEKLFEIVNQLNQGISLITTPQERDELATFNLAAGKKAKASTAYIAAMEYLNTGLQLLGSHGWQRCYSLTLALHEFAAEVACLSGQFALMEQQINEVLQNAKFLLDTIKVYEVKILAEVAQSRQLDAIKTALNVVEKFKVVFPQQPTPDEVEQSFQATQNLLAGKPLEALLELPEMVDPEALAIIKILAAVTAAVYQAMPALLPLIVFKQVCLSIQYGNALVSPLAYAWYGVILCGVIGEIELGNRAGQLALDLLKRCQTKEFKASTINMVYPFVKPWKHPIRDSLSALLEGYHSGLEMGALEYAAYCVYNYCSLSFFLGKELVSLQQEMAVYSQALTPLKQEVAHNYLKVFYQSTTNLISQNQQPWQFQGKIYDEAAMVPLHQAANDLYALGTLYINKLLLCYLFQEWQLAQEVADDAQHYLDGVAGCFLVPAFHFYDSLTQLAVLPNISEIDQERLQQRVMSNQEKLEKWADQAPINYLNKFYLVEAERYRVLGQIYQAMDYYDRSIAEAKTNGFLNEEALANELAGRFYLALGRERMAQDYLINAYYAYSHWGNLAKVTDLERRYPGLLSPVLQPEKRQLAADSTIFSVNNVVASNLGTQHSTTSGSISASVALDLITVLKASQTLSSEIQLEPLLSQLLQVVIENAGADKCALILLKEGRLIVEAMTILGEEMNGKILRSLPLEDCLDLAASAINAVKHTQQPLMVMNATSHPLLMADPYILHRHPKSLLCLPILHQGKLLGVLYLENNLATAAFTSHRIELLNLLCTQAAISIENARLFEHLEQTKNNLSQAQQLLTSVINNIPQQICWKDRNSVYLGCNQQAAIAAGVGSPYSIIGKIDHDLPWTKEEADWYRTCDRQVMESGTPKLHIIETQRQADGRQAWLDTSKIPLRDANGHVIGIVVTVEDITERRQAEQLLQQQKQELEQALQELQQTQMQLVQSEKMSALGNLVAGVAHEINNPVSFIAGNIEPALDYVKDLFGLIDLYQQIYPNPDADIEDEIEAIELDYVREDLPKLIHSMKLGVERIRNISTSLRIFSRADQDYKVPFNLHEGIDSTLLILKHRLKANEKRPAIEVIKNYGNLPEVKCFPGQLNQVFMNVLANAIDAIEESTSGRSFHQIKASENLITIQTEFIEGSDDLNADHDTVIIRVTDNGAGMTESVKQCIFDQLFTTKAVGKGTGLGLAIAHQIIVEKHGGSIEVESQLGQGSTFVITLPVNP